MQLFETLIVYLIIGIVIAVTLSLREGLKSMIPLWIICWPFFAPIVLLTSSPSAKEVPPTRFELTAIGTRLQAAMASLDGVSETVLGAENTRITTMIDGLKHSEVRISEMEALLNTPEFDPTRVEQTLDDLAARGLDEQDPRVSSVRARGANIKRLQAMRDSALADMERALLKLDEVSAQVRVLGFVGGNGLGSATDVLDEVGLIVEALTDGLYAV